MVLPMIPYDLQIQSGRYKVSQSRYIVFFSKRAGTPTPRRKQLSVPDTSLGRTSCLRLAIQPKSTRCAPHGLPRISSGGSWKIEFVTGLWKILALCSRPQCFGY